MSNRICTNCGYLNPNKLNCCSKCGSIFPIQQDCINYREIKDVHFKSTSKGWNWWAFFFTSIWCLLHKINWPICILLLTIILGVWNVNIDRLDYERYSSGGFELTSEYLFLNPLFLTLLVIYLIVKFIFGRRGNEILNGRSILRKYKREDLENKKLNWLSFFGGGVNLIYTKKWIWSILPLMIPVGFLFLFISDWINLRNFYSMAIFMIWIGIILYPISGIYSLLNSNKILLKEDITKNNIITNYNRGRMICLANIVFNVWLFFFSITLLTP